MALAERVLIDISAFYALAASNDSFHDQARRTYQRMVDWDQELWTTSYVLVETCALIQRRLGFDTLKDFLEPLRDPVHVVWVEHGIHSEAWQELVSRGGRGLSFVDWTTALAARRLRADVFTFDEGFEREGVRVIK